MVYKVDGRIYGFSDTLEVEFHKIDALFATIKDVENEAVSFTLINPFRLREYVFDLADDVKVLLDINEKTNILVYNIVIIQEPLDASKINFLAPLIFNGDNQTMAQIILKPEEYPDFGMAESIQSFR
ncbi:MAG: flagellar assembly protein FliW [Sulfurimonas sp.]|nr:MAG: flagellar assembly protein FliW [Sulfurimonas sp.]